MKYLQYIKTFTQEVPFQKCSRYVSRDRYCTQRNDIISAVQQSCNNTTGGVSGNQGGPKKANEDNLNTDCCDSDAF